MRLIRRKKLIGVKKPYYNGLRKGAKTLYTFMSPQFREETLTGLSSLKWKGEDGVKMVRRLWKKNLITTIPSCSQLRTNMTEKTSSVAFLPPQIP